jgi:hypothetical protein
MSNPIIKETEDYVFLVLSEEEQVRLEANYAIMHKEYGTYEAVFGVLYAGYEIIVELQNKLNEVRPTTKPPAVTRIH